MPGTLSKKGIPYLFDHIKELPRADHIFVVGAGETGSQGFAKIPRDACTIAVNSVLMAGCNPGYYPDPWTYWMVCDRRTPNQPCWKQPVPDKTLVLMLDIHELEHPQIDYCWRHGSMLRVGRPTLTWEHLQGGATIIVPAILWAYFLGAKHITLVAVDQQGLKHWDGSPANPGKKRIIWKGCKRVQYLCSQLIRNGIRIDSLTPTVLNIPMYRSGQ
jgi:hypothetical protein